MVLVTLLKTPEPSPEPAHSAIDCQGLNISPLPQSKSISNNKIKKKTCLELKKMLLNIAMHINTWKMHTSI